MTRKRSDWDWQLSRRGRRPARAATPQRGRDYCVTSPQSRDVGTVRAEAEGVRCRRVQGRLMADLYSLSGTHDPAPALSHPHHHLSSLCPPTFSPSSSTPRPRPRPLSTTRRTRSRRRHRRLRLPCSPQSPWSLWLSRSRLLSLARSLAKPSSTL